MRHFAFVPHDQQRRFRSARALGGGSRPTLPPMLYRFFHYVAAEFLGLLPCLAPNMYDSAAVEAAALFAPPVAVASAEPPSLSGNPYGGQVSMAQFIPKATAANQASNNHNAQQKACTASAFKDFRNCVVGGVVPGDIPGAVAIGICVTAGEVTATGACLPMGLLETGDMAIMGACVHNYYKARQSCLQH